MGSSHRDTGLVRVVGPVTLAASMISIVVGAGIFVVPAQLSLVLGSLAPLATLACAVVVGAIGVCMAESGSRVPSSGGVYAFVAAAFGRCVGYVAGILFCFSNVLACAAVSSALGDAVAAALPQSTRSVTHSMVVVSTVLVISATNIGGVRLGTRLVSLATVLKLVPLVLFLAIGAFALAARNFVKPAALGAVEIAHTLLFALFAFQGFETALCVSGEVRDPARTIPRAVVLALSAVTVLYIAVQIVAQGILGPALGHSDVPLADALGKILPALRLLMLAGAAVSMFGWITADLLSSPRILFAFARDGLLPGALGRLNARRAPHVAIVCYATLAIVLALSGSFAQLAAPATLVMALLYIAAAVASWRLARMGVAQAGVPLGFRWIGAAASVGTAGMLALIVLASHKEILGLLALTGLSFLAYLIQTRLVSRGNAPAAQIRL
jgi:basic amino acid/polyamine antiporter, APA family